MPIFTGPFVGFALGSGLAFIVQAGPAPAERRIRTVLWLFTGLVFMPICAYFASFWGDWAMAYVADIRSVPLAVLLLILALDGASVWGGFKTSQELAGRGYPRHAILALLLPLSAVAAFIIFFRDRLRIEGSYRQIQHQFGTQSIVGSPLGYALLWMNGLLIAGFVYSALRLREDSRPPKPNFEPTKTHQSTLGSRPHSI